MSLRLRRAVCGHRWTWAFLVAVGVLFYGEVFVYVTAPFAWPRLACDSCVRLLLVADPQILALRHGDNVWARLMCRDAVSHIAKTYVRAYEHFAPDAVLLLGDLTDDGRVSTNEEFEADVNTLEALFPATVKFAIPGDNDVGGGGEPIYGVSVARFARAFKRKQCIDVKGVVVCDANGLLERHVTHPLAREPPPTVKVALSHPPLLESPKPYTRAVLDAMEPSVIFSGHRHAAYHLTVTKDGVAVGTSSLGARRNATTWIDFESGIYHEFVVPSCSYRMGEADSGYGIAVIDKKGLTYSILWSPRRFDQLRLYLLTAKVLGLYTCLMIAIKLSSFFNRCLFKKS